MDEAEPYMVDGYGLAGGNAPMQPAPAPLAPQGPAAGAGGPGHSPFGAPRRVRSREQAAAVGPGRAKRSCGAPPLAEKRAMAFEAPGAAQRQRPAPPPVVPGPFAVSAVPGQLLRPLSGSPTFFGSRTPTTTAAAVDADMAPARARPAVEDAAPQKRWRVG